MSARSTETQTAQEAAAKEAAAKGGVEAELARRAPSATDCGICCKPYADIAAAAASSTSSLPLTAVLPCCHTVCRGCVRQCVERRSVACPVCLTRFNGITTKEHVDSLPRNPFAEDAVHAGARVQCSQCVAEDMVSEESAAVVRCELCAKDLCDAHELMHKRKPGTKDHALTPLAANTTAAVDVCVAHKAPLNTYCIDCKALVCLACTLKNGEHPTPAHHTVLLTEYLPRILTELDKAKKDATRRQAEGVTQLVAIRTTEAAAEERGAVLTSDVKRSFAVMVGILQRRETMLLEEVAKLTAAERTALEAAAGAEQRHWTALHGGVTLTEQLLSTETAPVCVGQLAHMANAHLVALAGKSVGPAPSLDEIKLFVDPSVQKVLETVGTLWYLRAYGPKCTVSGEGLKAASIGKTASFVLTAISRSDERVRVGGDCVEVRLSDGEDAAGAACAVGDAGDGTYTVRYTTSVLGTHRLHVRVNGTAVAGSPFAVAATPANSKTFRWGGSAKYDNRGIIYHLATAGGTRPWTNPHDAGVVVVTGHGKVYKSLSALVNNAVGILSVSGALGVWLAVDLKGQKVFPSGYVLGGYGSGGPWACPRSWNLEGSNDGATWTMLKSHTNDQTLNDSTLSAYWPIPAAQGSKAYSHFRVVLTGKSSYDNEYLVTSGIELYGELLSS